MSKLSVMACAVLLLSGCSTQYFSNSETLYLKSRNGEKVHAPSPLTNSNISDFYDLPVQNQDARVSLVPPIE